MYSYRYRAHAVKDRTRQMKTHERGGGLLADPDLLESEGLYLIVGAPLDAVISSVCLRKRMDIVRTEEGKDHVRASDYRMSIVPCPRMRSCNSKKLL